MSIQVRTKLPGHLIDREASTRYRNDKKEGDYATQEGDLHIGIARQHIPTCTLPIAMKISFVPLDTSQLKPWKVKANEKMFLKMMRHVKASIAISPMSYSQHTLCSSMMVPMVSRWASTM